MAVELAGLRGEMSTGFARLEGQINLLVQSSDSTRADVDSLDKRVSALEARRVPWGLVASVSGVVSAVGALAGYVAK